MPYLQVTTNVPMNRKQKVLIDEAISKALVIVPEEKPEYLMSHFQDCESLILQGTQDPCVIARLRVGQQMYERYPKDFDKMPAIITEGKIEFMWSLQEQICGRIRERTSWKPFLRNDSPSFHPYSNRKEAELWRTN